MKNAREYKHFGVMLDCSRNAVMKVSEVKHFIDCLEKMGYNTLELYTEDTYEIKGEPYFGYLRGRYTGEEIKEIDAYAKAHGVELIPCVQTLGHFTALVRNNVYAPIVDCNDILLVDEEKTYELIDKIFATLAENFTSRLVNIGMDEAHMVGLGKFLDKHGFENRFDILLRHLNKVVEIAAKYGFTPHMWSDMFFRLATKGNYYVDEKLDFPEEVVSKVPENIELAYWDYYHVNKNDYDVMFENHAQFKRKVWFAGGAWSWTGFAPLNGNTFKKAKAAMPSVIEHGIEDVIITMWGDNGGECSYFSLLPALYLTRQYANGNYDDAKIEKQFNSLFKLNFADFVMLDLPDMEYNNIAGLSKIYLYNDLFLGVYDKQMMGLRVMPYAKTAAALKKAAKRAGRYAYIFESQAKLCEVLAVKTDLGWKVRRAYQSADKRQLATLVKEFTVLEKKLQAFLSAFYVLWNTENKPHGWEIQDARLGGLIQRTKTCKARLKAYLAGKLTKIEELEEEILEFSSQRNYVDLLSRSKM